MNAFSTHRLAVALVAACATVLILAPDSRAGGDFIRGDFSADGVINLADPIGTLNYLSGGPTSECLDAVDANDDGVVNVVDPIYMFYFLFQGAASPPPPFLACGADPTGDALTCDDYPPCP